LPCRPRSACLPLRLFFLGGIFPRFGPWIESDVFLLFFFWTSSADCRPQSAPRPATVPFVFPFFSSPFFSPLFHSFFFFFFTEKRHGFWSLWLRHRSLPQTLIAAVRHVFPTRASCLSPLTRKISFFYLANKFRRPFRKRTQKSVSSLSLRCVTFWSRQDPFEMSPHYFRSDFSLSQSLYLKVIGSLFSTTKHSRNYFSLRAFRKSGCHSQVLPSFDRPRWFHSPHGPYHAVWRFFFRPLPSSSYPLIAVLSFLGVFESWGPNFRLKSRRF